MKNKTLIMFLIIGLTFSLQSFAVMKSNDGNADKIQEQMQTANQGDDMQVQIENNELEQNGNENESNLGDKDQIQEQERAQEHLQIQNQEESDLQDQNGNQAQNKNQERNQEQIQNQEKNGEVNGEIHKSVVANFVQELLGVADREDGRIGQQIREIAQGQNDTKEKVAEAIDTIKNQSIIKTFLVGPDHKSSLRLKAGISVVENQLVELNNLLDESILEESKTEIQNQIETMEQEKETINSFLEASNRQFNLFGWFIKLFVKTAD